MINKQNAEPYERGNKCDGRHLVKSNDLSVIQERVPSGQAEVNHFHNRSEQFFFVLSGIATLEVAGIPYLLEPQQGMHVPAGIEHQLRNETDNDIEFIVTSTPPSHGDRIEC